MIKRYEERGTIDCSKLTPEHRRGIICLEKSIEPGVKWEKILLDISSPTISMLQEVEKHFSNKNDLSNDHLMALVTLSDAANTFNFPPQHPIVGEAYIQHPLDTNFYLIATNYPSRVYEDVVSDFMNLLTILAVKRVRFKWLSGHNVMGGISAKANENNEEVSAGINGSSSSSKTFDGEIICEPKSEPRHPDENELRWYAHYPSWQTLAKTVTDGGAKSLSFTFSYDFKLSIGVKLAATLEGILAQFGINADGASSTKWSLELEF